MDVEDCRGAIVLWHMALGVGDVVVWGELPPQLVQAEKSDFADVNIKDTDLKLSCLPMSRKVTASCGQLTASGRCIASGLE